MQRAGGRLLCTPEGEPVVVERGAPRGIPVTDAF